MAHTKNGSSIDSQVFRKISSERLTLLYYLSQTFNSSLNIDEVLNNVIDEVITTMHAERGFVVLLDDSGELVFQAARGIDHMNVDDPQSQISRGVVRQVMESGEPVLTSNAQVDSRFSGMQSVAFLGLSSVMCAPLKVRAYNFGAIYVENRVQAGVFTEDDLDMLSAIASSAAIAIENARLYQVAVEKGRMERELMVAREVQNSFLPDEIHQPAGWEISAYLLPARQVGGDFYDVFLLPGSQEIGVVIADVCDKGVGAALFMALFRSLIRASSHQQYAMHWIGASSKEYQAYEKGSAVESRREPVPQGTVALKNAINLTNDYIANFHGHTNMFATVFFGMLDPTTGKLVYINGGHEPPVLLHEQGVKTRLNPTGPALGLFPNMEFNIAQIDFEPGDTFLAFTDGAPDVLNPQGDPFSEKRLLSLAQTDCPSSASLLSHIKENLIHYMSSSDQFDDITLLAIRRKLET